MSQLDLLEDDGLRASAFEADLNPERSGVILLGLDNIIVRKARLEVPRWIDRMLRCVIWKMVNSSKTEVSWTGE